MSSKRILIVLLVAMVFLLAGCFYDLDNPKTIEFSILDYGKTDYGNYHVIGIVCHDDGVKFFYRLMFGSGSSSDVDYYNAYSSYEEDATSHLAYGTEGAKQYLSILVQSGYKIEFIGFKDGCIPSSQILNVD